MTPDRSRRGFDRDRAPRRHARFAADAVGAVHQFRGPRGLAEFLSPLHAESPNPVTFSALMHSQSIGAVTITNVRTTPCSIARTAAADSSAELSLLLLGSPGRLMPENAGRDREFRAGQLIVLNSAMAGTISIDSVCEGRWISLPMSRLGGQAQTAVHRLNPLPPDTAFARAMTAFVDRMAAPSRSVTSSAGADTAVESALVGLVRSFVVHQRFDGHAGDHVTRQVRGRALDLIERDFRDPELCAEAIARDLKVSLRQLFRCFAGMDESLTEKIADRRLRACLTWLK